MATTLSETDMTRLMWCSTSSTVTCCMSRTRQIYPLAHREGQSAGRQPRMRLQVHELGELLGALRDAPLLGLRPRQSQRVGEEARRGAAVTADLDVVEHRHAVEQRHILKCA